jgi:hypothetical protein
MDSTSNLILEWSNFIPISELNDYNEKNAGVYVWGFTIGTEFIPYYVGVADNIIYRIYQHINSIIGGLYTIYHRDSLADFKDIKNQPVQIDMNKGKIYDPNWPNGYKEFLDKWEALQPHIKFMIDTFTFSFAVTSFSGEDLKEIEKCCINDIGKERLSNTRAGRCQKFLIQHSGNTSFIEKS